MTFTCDCCQRPTRNYDGDHGTCYECQAKNEPVKEGYGDGGAGFIAVLLLLTSLGVMLALLFKYLTIGE